MSQNTNPLSVSEPWNLVADGYAETTMLVFEQYADVAIAASKFKPNSTKKTQLGSHPHDVNPHPQPFSQKEKGAKSLSRRERGWGEGTPATSLPQREIEQTGHRNIKLHCGDAQTLPYRDATFDAAFSLFGLMFFPDRQRGFAEIYRTLKPGGSIAVTSWAPVDQSPAMMTMFGALRAIKPDLPQPQRSIGTLENPDVFRQEMHEAGFRNIEIRSVTKAFPIPSIPEFWDFMVKGSAPIQMMKNELGEELWREKEKLALAWLGETLPALKGPLTSDAWLGGGVK